MSLYLIHQNRDGDPLGVFSENTHYYFPSTQSHEDYGVSVVNSRGSDTPWLDWVEQLASKSPSPKARWDTYDHPPASLYQVLIDCRDTLES